MSSESTDPRAARFEEAGILWWTSVRTYRPGDWGHYALAIPGTALGLLILWIGIANGTMADSWVTPVVVAGLLGYGWLALTKRFNRRTITLDSDRLRAWDGPLWSLANRVSVTVDEIGPLETNERKTLTMPPTQFVRTYDVDAGGVRGHIIKKLPTQEEADKTRAGLAATIARID